jgi:transcriptional regulator with XRE-family HTH domain
MTPTRAAKPRARPATSGAKSVVRAQREERLTLVASQDDASIKKLGARVQTLRAAHGWTLGELAVRCGVSRSSLSKIERDEVSPTYDAIQRIALGFNIPVVELFSEQSSAPALGRRTVSRADQGETHQGRGYLYHLLCNELSTKKMLPYLATIDARSIGEAGGYVRHSGEEFLFVLSGTVQFFTEHYAPVVLEVGDSIYLDSQMGHTCISLSSGAAKVLWITTDEMMPTAGGSLSIGSDMSEAGA